MAGIAEEEDKEFNLQWGWLDLGFTVSKETGETYFETIEHPALHVFAIAQYLMDKVKKIQRDHDKQIKKP